MFGFCSCLGRVRPHRETLLAFPESGRFGDGRDVMSTGFRSDVCRVSGRDIRSIGVCRCRQQRRALRAFSGSDGSGVLKDALSRSQPVFVPSIAISQHYRMAVFGADDAECRYVVVGRVARICAVLVSVLTRPFGRMLCVGDYFMAGPADVSIFTRCFAGLFRRVSAPARGAYFGHGAPPVWLMLLLERHYHGVGGQDYVFCQLLTVDAV